MKVVAYARQAPGAPTVVEQVARAERWAHRERHDVLRLAGFRLTPEAKEYPPLGAVAEASVRSDFHALVVTDLSVLGDRLAATLLDLDMLQLGIVVLGGERDTPLHVPPIGVKLLRRLAAQVKTNLQAKPRRVCPPRVRVDTADVQRMTNSGERLADIAQHLGVSRSTLVRRLRRDRDNEAVHEDVRGRDSR